MSVDLHTKGNLSMIALVDSSKKEEFQILGDTMWNAFEHFGMPYEVLDLNHKEVSAEDLALHSILAIGQARLGSSISRNEAQAIADAVKEGVGFVSFDGRADLYEQPIKDIFGISARSESNGEGGSGGCQDASGVRAVNDIHYMTYTRDNNVTMFHKPVEATYIKNLRGDSVILMSMLGNLSGCPALLATNYGKGRAVTFAFSPHVWLNEYLGHANGLDDVFWKSIVWAASKPFIMLAMPPFVTMRIDDCSGSCNRFGWIDIANKHGYIPNVGIFPDNISDEDAKVVKEKYDAGLAEFSPHAFKWTDMIYWDSNLPEHDAGKERTKDELKRLFAKLDKQLETWGIGQSRVLNSHWGEVGRNAIPFLLERGVAAMLEPYWIGEPYFGWHLDWKPRPYGNFSYYFDRHPEFPDIFCVGSSYDRRPFVQGYSDEYVEWKGDRYRFKGFDEASAPDIIGRTHPPLRTVEEIARAGSEEIRMGLDNMFVGTIVTHEQRISFHSLEEWDAILTRIDLLTAKYDKMHRGWDYVAEYAKNKIDSQITQANFDQASRNVNCALKGRASMPLYLYVFKNSGESVEHMFQEVPAFKDSTTVTFNIGAFLDLNMKGRPPS